jgi:uncharacterized membrane protein YgdD (TMEM256/DUF423 family)
MNLSARTFFLLAGWLGALAVALGAFGAHGLKPLLTDYQLDIFNKGVQYHFVHLLALLAVALRLEQSANRVSPWLVRAGWLFVAGIAAFSGSLYLLACRELLPFPVGWAGPVTPLGGLCFLAGWLAFGWATWKGGEALQAGK